ncbi:alpha/beta fold hydrolase [Sulfitobacter sp. JB4-11]|uniref:alpha/beta fold hydrolase n=1 Tax=Sulfitobacter rhodophyticola TaxID=3238304 RepID=UPI003515405C
MPKVELNGTVIHYQQLGEGPDIVLVHGLYANVAIWWQRIALRLARRYRVTALDLRGHGYSGMPESGYRAADLARDVLDLMDHLGVEKPHLLGHSFGGAIVLACAVQQPDLISRATLADAWIPSLQKQPPLPTRRSLPALRRRLAARGIEVRQDMPRVALAYLEELADAPGAPRHLPATGRGTGDAASVRPARMPHAQRRWLRLMRETTAWSDFQDPEALEPEQLASLHLPVRLIYGRRSSYLASRDALAGLLPNRELTNVDGVGHYFPVLHPDVLPDILLDETRPISPGANLESVGI